MSTTQPQPRSDRAKPDAQDLTARAAAELDSGAGADLGEFEAFANKQDPLDIAAATWVTRKRSGLNAEDEAELQAWLDADPRHIEAFDDMEATFGDVQQLPDDAVAQLRAGLPAHDAATQAAPLRPAPPTSGGSVSMRPAIGGRSILAGLNRLVDLLRPLAPQAVAAALAFTLVGGGWMGWSLWLQQPVFEQAYATAQGQQLKAILPDAAEHTTALGSNLQLDTATQAQVRLYRDRREVHLQSGQAMFAVHSDPQRPFHVYVGALRITVVGTRFSVRHTSTGLDAGQTVVAVEEGRVRVAPLQPSTQRQEGIESAPDLVTPLETLADHAVELSAGQTVVADAQGHIGPVIRQAANAMATWRDGRISFDQAPLAQAIAEFERYGHTGLVVRDPAVAALPVGGSYSLKQWQRFAQTLPQVLPVRLIHRSGVTEVVAQ
jgi:transmembrane sensor